MDTTSGSVAASRSSCTNGSMLSYGYDSSTSFCSICSMMRWLRRNTPGQLGANGALVYFARVFSSTMPGSANA